MEAWTEVVVPYPQHVGKANWKPGTSKPLRLTIYVKSYTEGGPVTTY